MKGSVTVIILAILLVWVALIGLGDTHISVADTSIPNNEVNGSEASNSSTSATITITMYTVPDE